MGILVKFEFKKLFNKKMNIIVIIVCLFFITLLFSMAGKDFLATDNSGKSYKGKEAISVRKEQMNYKSCIMIQIILLQIVMEKSILNVKFIMNI